MIPCGIIAGAIVRFAFDWTGNRQLQQSVCEKYRLKEQLVGTGVACHTLLYRQIPNS